jgi:hypothetical protein
MTIQNNFLYLLNYKNTRPNSRYSYMPAKQTRKPKLLPRCIAYRYSQLESKNRKKQTNVESKSTQPEFRKRLIISLVIAQISREIRFEFDEIQLNNLADFGKLATKF